jgi:hypothetical protein
MTSPQELLQVVLIGIGATAFMDAWLAILQRFGVQTLNFALIGRWVGHLGRGRFAHAAIGQAAPVTGERLLGWLTHYAVGIAFAGLLVGVAGTAWMRNPAFLPAIALGVCSAVAPLFVMQPAMGAGFAASRTPAPCKNRIRSVANHAVFGLGLYLSAVIIEVTT